MASSPGILTDWPWTPLGSFKYVILAPWVVHSVYSFTTAKKEGERDITYLLIFPILMSRVFHNQIWISLSRYRTAKGATRIVDKGLEFDQVDRERNWDDQILLSGVFFYTANMMFKGASKLPMLRTDGVVMMILLHAGPVEFLYYWLHRALHRHYLYSRYHSHHHSSIVTEPISSVIHPFAEHMAYFSLFAIPLMTLVFTRTASMAAVFGYITFIDFMNNMGHCNFELIPTSLFSFFPPLKLLLYTPSYHSLHHTQFRTNYSLFMPLYDYLYGTMDKTTDQLHKTSLKRKEESPDVVHLTHLTSPNSIYYSQLGFASLASHPSTDSQWYLWLLWPFTLWAILLAWISKPKFVVEAHHFNKLLKLQTWAVPRYTIQYLLRWQHQSINSLIEEAILEADQKGTKVLSLGLLNQGEELNEYGGVYVERNPQLKLRIVDGSSLATAVVLNLIPKETTGVLLRGNLTKVAYAISSTLCRGGMQVATLHEDEYTKLKKVFNSRSAKFETNLVLSNSYSHKVWLVGEGLSKEEQMKAPKGTIFIPFSHFPLKPLRKADCFYHYTPAMITPPSIHNLHSCENWLPRRVMSAWRIGGIVHAMEGWTEHECGHTMSVDIQKVWQASLRHGFQPFLKSID